MYPLRSEMMIFLSVMRSLILPFVAKSVVKLKQPQG